MKHRRKLEWMEGKWITRNPTKQQTPPSFPKMQNVYKHLIVFMLNRRVIRSRGWKLLKKIWKILTMVCKGISQPRELHSVRKHSWDINFNYFRKITIVPGCLVDMPVCTEGENGGKPRKVPTISSFIHVIPMQWRRNRRHHQIISDTCAWKQTKETFCAHTAAQL